ncbi:MAG: site-2 protease family protein [Gammaproteobacteria bacterium]|nr:MAG: site-2 protease family protein [Gammaproteobacteria bacterium]RKZ70918.1 MAG: site-2 protease family protein [Gammaproteobacteria bacterium]
MPELNLISTLFVFVIPVIFAVTVHEVAHGWVASRLGDQTAKSMGRLTLNPLKHIDPVGTILVPAIMYFASGFIFGWAKPVPVNWRNLGHPRRDMAIVAIAGPAANLLMLLFWAIFAKMIVLSGNEPNHLTQLLFIMCGIGVTINIVLMILNLFPILPLDGGRVLTAMLPPNLAIPFSRLEPYGLIILVALLFSGILWKILTPFIGGTLTLISQLTQIPIT